MGEHREPVQHSRVLFSIARTPDFQYLIEIIISLIEYVLKPYNIHNNRNNGYDSGVNDDDHSQ